MAKSPDVARLNQIGASANPNAEMRTYLGQLGVTRLPKNRSYDLPDFTDQQFAEAFGPRFAVAKGFINGIREYLENKVVLDDQFTDHRQRRVWRRKFFDSAVSQPAQDAFRAEYYDVSQARGFFINTFELGLQSLEYFAQRGQNAQLSGMLNPINASFSQYLDTQKIQKGFNKGRLIDPATSVETITRVQTIENHLTQVLNAIATNVTTPVTRRRIAIT